MKKTSILKAMKEKDWLIVIGDTARRGKCPSEAVEQVTFFAKLRREHHEYAAIAIHPRNEGERHHAQTMKQKAEGMTAGAADIVIPCTPAFVCELKRQNPTASTITDKQIEYLKAAQNLGAFACVALGYKAAYEAFEKHILK